MSSSLFNAGFTRLNVLRRHIRTRAHVENTSTASRTAKERAWGALHNNSHHRFQRVWPSRHSSRSSTSTRNWWRTPSFSFTVKMSSAGGAGGAAAAMYVVVSNPVAVAARPEDADEKAHHLKNGKGFTNPWDSFRDFAGWQMGMRLLW